MKTTLKIALILIGCVAIFATAIPAYFYARYLYYKPKREEAMRFCESLIPMIEAAKQNGEYPEKVNPKWIEGRKVPELIKLEAFYSSVGSRYFLQFRNPGDFMDDIWGYNGSAETGTWINYD